MAAAKEGRKRERERERERETEGEREGEREKLVNRVLFFRTLDTDLTHVIIGERCRHHKTN